MDKFFNNRKLLLFVITLVAFTGLAIVSLSQLNNNNSRPIDEATGATQEIAAASTNWFDSFVTNIQRLFNTYSENEILRQHANQLSGYQIDNERLVSENAELRALLNLENTLSDYEKVTANVISRSPDMWNNTITIDTGENNGVEVGMMVMAPNGVIGRVTSVTPSYASVTLLTTAQLQASVLSAMIMGGNNTINGVINRYDDNMNRYIMSNVSIDADVSVGSNVVTSGLSGLSPRGLLIGTVESVEIDNSGLFKQVVVTPAGDSSSVRFVTVIKRSIGNGGT